MNFWEHIRKDDYQYKLIRMVDDYLVDNKIGFRYKNYFIRSECSYNGTGSDMLFVEFYFRPKYKKEPKYNLIKKTFGEENLNEIITQNGMKMKMTILSREKRNGDKEIEGLGFFTSKKWINKRMEEIKDIRNLKTNKTNRRK